MKKTKQPLAVLLCLTLLAGLFSGCGSPTADDGALHIITTIFPLYDWVCQIVGDTKDVEVTLLLDNGVDLHNYQITANDIVQIASCDLFVYVGGESDHWVNDTLAQTTNDHLTAVNLLSLLGEGAREEEIVEGMETEDSEEAEEDGGPEYDEHVWLSLKNAAFYCQSLAETIASLDEKNREVYEANAAAYMDALETLDEDYASAIAESPRDTLLFGDRFPFRYLAADYGLTYYAAFSGCASETEASFETITFLANKVDELDLNVILQIETSDGSIPETIRQNTAAKNQSILTMNSLQAATAKERAQGISYLSVMKENLNVLKEALK